MPSPKTMYTPKTLTRHMVERARQNTSITPELTDLVSTIALGVKMISGLVSRSGIKTYFGFDQPHGIAGEGRESLDVQADEILVRLLSESGFFALLVSEVRDEVVATAVGHSDAEYVVAFDPLDGTTNLGTCIPVGTIFSVFRKKDPDRPAIVSDLLQSGHEMVAAGYAIYGAKTVFVFSYGNGVHSFTLDRAIGDFVLTHADMTMPENGNWYSVNEGYYPLWSKKIQAAVQAIKEGRLGEGPYMSRYIGSLVVDFDRNLREGGIYLYPSNENYPSGRLHLLYECMPIAFLIEQAGGRATDGERNILDIIPNDIHQRSPLFLGSRIEMEAFKQLLEEEGNSRSPSADKPTPIRKVIGA